MDKRQLYEREITKNNMDSQVINFLKRILTYVIRDAGTQRVWKPYDLQKHIPPHLIGSGDKRVPGSPWIWTGGNKPYVFDLDHGKPLRATDYTVEALKKKVAEVEKNNRELIFERNNIVRKKLSIKDRDLMLKVAKQFARYEVSPYGENDIPSQWHSEEAKQKHQEKRRRGGIGYAYKNAVESEMLNSAKKLANRALLDGHFYGYAGMTQDGKPYICRYDAYKNTLVKATANGIVDFYQPENGFEDYIIDERDNAIIRYIDEDGTVRAKKDDAYTEKGEIRVKKAVGFTTLTVLKGAHISRTNGKVVNTEEAKDYEEAKKNNNLEAAIRVVKRCIGKRQGEIREIAAEHPDAIVVPISSPTSTNALSHGLAELYGECGLKIDDSIREKEKVGHTGTTQIQRMLSTPKVEGEVIPGQKYIICDDVFTFGGSVMAFAKHIRDRGGIVCAVTVLASSQHGRELSPTEEDKQEFFEKYKREQRQDIYTKMGIHGLEDLTAPQIRFLNRCGYVKFMQATKEKT